MNHHAVEKPSVTAQYTKTAEKPDFKRCSDLSGIEKVHRNSIKITVDLWKLNLSGSRSIMTTENNKWVKAIWPTKRKYGEFTHRMIVFSYKAM